VDGRECPALYFDPLLVIGGDREIADPREPNYCTRCDAHHYLPGKEYAFLHLKPLGEKAVHGDAAPLREELALIKGNLERSQLYRHFREMYDDIRMDSLRVSCIAEKALLFLYTEQNLLPNELFLRIVKELEMDLDYLARRLSDCRRAAVLEAL
jgi:thymidine kinase